MSFPTPVQAEGVSSLTPAQLKTVRESFGIVDSPLRADRTYVIFDAVAGNNNFHINTGASLTYSIIQGDGSQEISYTDTGGTKVLNFDTAGRFLITIKETFQGLSTNGASAAEKAKYISVIGGTNHPTTIATNAFKDCLKLEYISFHSALIIGISAFNGCILLKEIDLPIATNILEFAFNNCNILELLNLPLVTEIDQESFANTSKLIKVILPSAINNINIDESAFADSSVRSIEILYSAGLTLGPLVFANVILDILHVTNSTLLQAKGVRDKFIAAGATFSSEFKLISDDLELSNNSINERIINTNDSLDDVIDSLGGLKTKVVNIGVWNMNTDSSKNVAHGLVDASKIRGVQALIIPDVPGSSLRLMNLEAVGFATGTINGGINEIRDNDIELLRYTGGLFDNLNYDKTEDEYNRGYLKIDYDAS